MPDIAISGQKPPSESGQPERPALSWAPQLQRTRATSLKSQGNFDWKRHLKVSNQKSRTSFQGEQVSERSAEVFAYSTDIRIPECRTRADGKVNSVLPTQRSQIIAMKSFMSCVFSCPSLSTQHYSPARNCDVALAKDPFTGEGQGRGASVLLQIQPLKSQSRQDTCTSKNNF